MDEEGERQRQQEITAKLEAAGPAEVRARIATSVYLGADKALAVAWLGSVPR